MQYRPDNFVIIKITDKLYKVLAGWSGGYLYGDSWRMNSGITDIVDSKEYYSIHGSSGSVYKVHKESEGLSMITSSVLPKECKVITIKELVESGNYKRSGK